MTVRVLPTVAVCGTVATVLLVTDTPVEAVARLMAFNLLAVLVPGAALHRVLRGPQRLWVTELALGYATGLLWLLPGWAIATVAGLPAWWYAIWAVPPVAVAVGVPSLRRRVLTRFPRSLPPAAGWLAAGAATLVVLRDTVNLLNKHTLPQTHGRANPIGWYEDVYWHLGNIAELMHHLPPQTPQVAGEPLRYHWFYAAEMAAQAVGAGVDPAIVLTRTWSIGVDLAVIGLCVALGHRLSGRAWVGGLAALLVALPPVLVPAWLAVAGTEPALEPYSPSQDLGLLFGLVALLAVLPMVRGRGRAGDWVVFVAMMLALPGAKVSVAPILLAGLGTATLVLLVRRERWWPLALATVSGAVAMVVAMPMAAGAGAGVDLGFAPWATNSALGRLLLGIEAPTSSPSYQPFLVLVGVTAVVNLGWVAIATPLLRRGHPVAWLCVGAGVAGLVLSQVVRQDGGSQGWFLRAAQPLLALLVAWAIGECWRRASRDRSPVVAPRAAAVGLLVGGGAWVLLGLATGSAPTEPAQVLTVPTTAICALGVVVLAGIVWWFGYGRRHPDAEPMALGLACAVLGAALVPGVGRWLPVAPPPGAVTSLGPVTTTVVVVGLALVALGLVVRPNTPGTVRRRVLSAVALAVAAALVAGWSWWPPGDMGPRRRVSAGQVAAARWLAEHSTPDEVIATNVHCMVGPTKPHCGTRVFWITGLTGRRALVEGWAYTSQAHLANGKDGWPADFQPFHDQALFALNDRAFTDPDAATLRALRARGVRWLFADTTAGPVSPRLAELAVLSYRGGSATVYRL